MSTLSWPRRLASDLLVLGSAGPQARLSFLPLATVFLMLTLGVAVSPQSQSSAAGAKTYKARLSPVPIDLTMANTIAGVGSVTAVLNGAKLTVNGTFEGLKSPATLVRIHKGQRGVRGEPILDLTATKATSGTISGTVDLTPSQVQDLQNSRLYIQLHSEKAPDGNLWGWLLPQDARTPAKPQERQR